MLSRIFTKTYGRTSGRTINATVHRSENLNLTVPAAKAEATRTAVEGWLAGHDVSAAVTVEDAGEGKSRIRAKLGDDDAAKLDFTDEGVQTELQNLLADAAR